MLTAIEVRRIINQVIDPCSAARGVPVGLVDMGLLGDVDVIEESDEEYGVEATMYVTGPSCLMSMEMESRVRVLIEEAGASWVRIRWDAGFVWTQDRMRPSARTRLAQRRDELRGAISVANQEAGAAHPGVKRMGSESSPQKIPPRRRDGGTWSAIS